KVPVQKLKLSLQQSHWMALPNGLQSEHVPVYDPAGNVLNGNPPQTRVVVVVLGEVVVVVVVVPHTFGSDAPHVSGAVRGPQCTILPQSSVMVPQSNPSPAHVIFG